MNSSQRIALNTAATYARSVLAVGLALFSSRWVLSALGPTDFGLFSLVGSIIMFITFLNSVLASSVSRHFAYAIGQGDFAEVNRWFNAALSIHLCLATALVFVGWLVGEYVIANILTIPTERMLACLWVFRVSLISAFFSMISIPFVAMFTAQQHITELSVWGTLRSVLIFILAYILMGASSDPLLFYTVGMVGILVLIQCAQIIRAVFVFRECRIVLRKWLDRRRARGIFSFAAWNLIGCSGGILRNQGSAILLNLFFGPGLNAAYGIANQVSGQANQLAAAMVGAFSPEITASEGRGARTRMLSLALRSSRIGTILVLLFAIPLMIEMDYVLRLWLRTPPPYSAAFCQLILGTFVIDRLTVGYMLAVNAHGKIAGYQATVGTTLLLTLPLAWLFLELGYQPSSVGVAFIITMVVCSFGRVLWARRLLGVTVRSWVKSVALPCILVAISATLAALVPFRLLSPSFARLVLTIFASTGIISLVTWLVAFDAGERQFIRHNAGRLWAKLGMLTASAMKRPHHVQSLGDNQEQ